MGSEDTLDGMPLYYWAPCTQWLTHLFLPMETTEPEELMWMQREHAQLQTNWNPSSELNLALAKVNRWVSEKVEVHIDLQDKVSTNWCDIGHRELAQCGVDNAVWAISYQCQIPSGFLRWECSHIGPMGYLRDLQGVTLAHTLCLNGQFEHFSGTTTTNKKIIMTTGATPTI